MRSTKLEDWQLGNESKTPPLERVELMKEWLLQNKLDVLTSKKPIEDKPVVGFEDLDMYD